jgi:hypothetical protein
MSELSEAEFRAKERELSQKLKELEIELKRLEISDKEHQRENRPSKVWSIATNPAVVAALIAAWVSVSAGVATYYTSQSAARSAADSDKRKFEAELLVEATRIRNDPAEVQKNLQFWLESGMLTGTTADSIRSFLKENSQKSVLQPASGSRSSVLPPK